MKIAQALVSLVFVPASAALAQPAGNTFMLGAGVVAAPEYPGGRALETKVVPLVNLRNEIAPRHSVYVTGPGGGYAYAVDDRLQVGVHAQYRGDRSPSDDARLAGLPDVDGTVEMGPRVRYQLTDRTGVEARALADIGDGHGGATARLGADHTLPVTSNLSLRASAGVNYGSDDFANAYYGVPGYAARPGRPAYRPDGGITHVDAGVQANYALTKNWLAQGGLGMDVLTGDAADSPLVKSDVQPRVMLGVMYRF